MEETKKRRLSYYTSMLVGRLRLLSEDPKSWTERLDEALGMLCDRDKKEFLDLLVEQQLCPEPLPEYRSI